MRRLLILALLCLLPWSSAFAEVRRSEIVIPLNRSELLVYDKEMKEVVIADPNVADVVVHGSSRVSVVAKALGRTNLRVFDASGTLVTDAVVVITYDLPEIRRALKNFFPNERIGVELVNNNVAITGMISDAETSQRAVRIVEEYVGGQRTKDDQQVPAVINLAKIRSGQQVMLRVRVGEMQRTTAKQLGLNLDAARSVGNFAISLGSAAVSQGETSRITAGLNAGSASLSALLDALEKEGLFKVLAEPNLVAISGERAEFLAGGEFPIPVAQGNGATSVQFREYGVGVQFTPLVLSPNRIRLVVQPEVSEIDSSVATRDGTPGLLSRRVKTTVELAPGESFMIAGLIQDTAQSSVREMPGLSEIPILGSMLRRSTYQRFERELVIAVTPYLVDPISGAELRMPSDDFRAPSLMESFFFGALGSLSGDVLRKSQVPSLEGPVGFMVD